jgi:hypothetical protein
LRRGIALSKNIIASRSLPRPLWRGIFYFGELRYAGRF